MMARPYWSGQMKISLLTFGIQLFTATNSASEIAFHQIDRKSGRRVRHKNVVDEETPVENAEIVKGFEYEKGKYLVIEPEEIASLRIQSRTTLELSQFVDLKDLPATLYEKPYYVVPRSDQPDEAFAVIREALAQTAKAGIGELAFGGREHLMAVAAPPEKGAKYLIAYALRYGEELRQAAGFLPDVKDAPIGKRQLAMATELIRQYSAPLDLTAFKDDYESALRKMIDAKLKHEPLIAEDVEPARPKVVDLMDALRKSVSMTRKQSSAKNEPSAKTKAGKGPQLVKPARRAHRAA